MEETKKKRIVIASVLKPVDDTRMFEKIAQTLSKTQLYDVHVIGYPTKTPSRGRSSVTLHAGKAFKRLSLGRLIRPFRILQNNYVVNPALVIITTHELLLVSIISKLLWRNVQLVYGVQHNCFPNVLCTPACRRWLRTLVA